MSAEDLFMVLFVAPAALVGAGAVAFGWIEIGPVGWVLLIGAAMAIAVVRIAAGLLAAIADLLAGRD